jgi:hypothetical protein
MERVYRKLRVILGTHKRRGVYVSAQASRHEKKTRFLFRLGLVRPFSSRAREENQNDLARSLFPTTWYLHGYSREAQEKFFAELFFKKATSLVRSLSPINQNLNF